MEVCMRLAKWVVCGAVVFSIGFGASTGAQAGRAQEPDVLSALLAEVRGLRQAIEQMAAAGPRVQLALGRLQLQEQRVNTMIRRLEALHEAVAKAEKDAATAEASLAPMQRMLGMDKAPPDENNPMSAMVEGFKKGIAAANAEVQRLQSEEAQLQQQIAVEQGRWGDINRALEELERAFSKR
jgi:chromosome segregation ATPase